jgi:polyhydroxybutyrate depolymerase
MKTHMIERGPRWVSASGIAGLLFVFACGSGESSSMSTPIPMETTDDGMTAPSDSAQPDDAPRSGTGGSSDPSTSTDTAMQDGGGRPMDAAAQPGLDSADAGAQSKPDSADASVPSEPDSVGPRPSAACDGDLEPPPSGTVMMTVGGLEREYLLHVPSTAGEAPMPLVLSFHGMLMTSQDQERISMLNPLADSEGFAIAYPQGSGALPCWNAGACCGCTTDDVAFADALIDHIGDKVCIDLNRVYANGFSNGGMLTYRLACELADRIAAFAPVSGSITVPLEGCQPSRPVPLLHFHGVADPIVPFEGGGGPGFPSVREEVEIFAARNGCSPSPQVTLETVDETGQTGTCERYSDCDAGADVTLCTVDPGHHTWPGADMLADGPPMADTPQTIPLTELIWDFFRSHPMRQGP